MALGLVAFAWEQMHICHFDLIFKLCLLLLLQGPFLPCRLRSHSKQWLPVPDTREHLALTQPGAAPAGAPGQRGKQQGGWETLLQHYSALPFFISQALCFLPLQWTLGCQWNQRELCLWPQQGAGFGLKLQNCHWNFNQRQIYPALQQLSFTLTSDIFLLIPADSLATTGPLNLLLTTFPPGTFTSLLQTAEPALSARPTAQGSCGTQPLW